MREKERKLFSAITNVREDYIEEACENAEKSLDDNRIGEKGGSIGHGRKSKIGISVGWRKGLLAAASIVLLLWCGIGTMVRFDYLTAGCSAYPGTIADGTYYYQVSHKGIYAYTPDGEAEKLISTFWVDDWQVNDYGLYFVCGKSLYVRPHETKKWERLYTGRKCTHIRLNLQLGGNVITEVYNKRREIIYEVLVDGKTGEVLEMVMPPTAYQEYYRAGKYSELHYQVGERSLELENVGKEYVFRLCENGKAILPEDTLVYRYSHCYFGDTLVLYGYREDFDNADYQLLIVLRPDGNDTILTVDNSNYSAGTEEYLFYSKDEQVWCLALLDGETWQLTNDVESTTDFYDLAADKTHLYSCAPWRSEQECWWIQYDESGRPTGLTLVDRDISKSSD